MEQEPDDTIENANESSAEENNVTDPIINLPPEGSASQTTTDMEVHKHPHHVTHKKRWTEYLLEFLMIFLAVFLGFIAENIRENSVERHREKQFIQSMVNDLIADTEKLNSIISRRTVREKSLDSLTRLMNSDSAKSQTSDIYYISATASRTLLFRFVPNDGTMQQLKNSGAFRLIRSRHIADWIGKYDVSVRNALRQGEVEETIIHDYRLASAKIFDAPVYDQMMDADLNLKEKPKGNPPLLDYNKDDLNNWNFKLYSMKGINKANRRDARLLFKEAKNLLKILTQEYHL